VLAAFTAYDTRLSAGKITEIIIHTANKTVNEKKIAVTLSAKKFFSHIPNSLTLIQFSPLKSLTLYDVTTLFDILYLFYIVMTILNLG